MGKLKGFRARETDSLVKRAASALIWIRKQPGGESKFISWTELYAELTGTPVDDVNPQDVLDRLRGKGYYVKAFLRESGYGWTFFTADRSMIRATSPGDDSARNCTPYYQRKAVRASENFVNWTDKTVGDLKKVHRTKENEAVLTALASALPKHRAVMATLGMVHPIAPKEQAHGPRAAKRKAA